ncbi:MAG: LUD domain-containing protein [Chitinophagia bacterium]|jgi:L-lactate dehydrogenase complex protein LldG|nr:lactate utilization protein B/C [Chitinophagia bacterium]
MAGNAKDTILKKIKQALKQPVPVPFPAIQSVESFFPLQQEPALEFAERFTQLQGRFSYCSSEAELVSQLLALTTSRKWEKLYCRETAICSLLEKNGWDMNYHPTLPDCDVAITSCEHLVARTGSIILSSSGESGRTVSVYAPIHICIAYSHQLVNDIGDGIEHLLLSSENEYPSLVTLATGPSRTADIEKTLVVGVHGPKEVFCFLIDS